MKAWCSIRIRRPRSIATCGRSPGRSPAFRAQGRARQFHDSFEYYNASWTAALPEMFQKMHGYDIQSFAAAARWREPLDDDTLSRVKGDYRRTLAKLHLDYVNAWVALGACRRIPGAQPGARRARQSARSVRRRGYSRDRIVRAHRAADRRAARRCGGREHRSGSAGGDDRAFRVVGGACHGPAAGLERNADVAARELSRVARRGEAAARPAVRRRHQSHLLSRHGLFAGRRASGRAGFSTPRRSSRRPIRCGTTSARCMPTSRACSRCCRPARPTTTSCCTGRSMTWSITAPDSWSSTACTRTNGSPTRPPAAWPRTAARATRSISFPTRS